MSFRETCAEVVHQSKASVLRLPDHPKLAKLAAAFENMPSLDSATKPKELRVVADEIASAVRARLALSRRQVRQAPWCLWPREIRLAEERDVLLATLEAISVAESPGPFRALASEFVTHFASDMAGIDLAAPCLKLLASKWGGHWGGLQTDMNIFDPDNGPCKLADAVARQDRTVSAILRDYRLEATSAEGGYGQAVTAQLLHNLARGGEPDHLRRLDKVKRFALAADGRALFVSQKVLVVEALLTPMMNGDVAKDVTTAILIVVLDMLGDPRLVKARSNWIAVTAELKNLVVGWLTEQSLRQFLDIVDQTAVESMWRYRRAFWQSVFDAGLISAAWVAFGPDGRKIAASGTYKGLKCAELFTDDKSVEPGHAVLLMQIGAGVVADWSHSGKCNIWYQVADPKAPTLFRDSYPSSSVAVGSSRDNVLTSGRVNFSHTAPSHYNWQHKAAEHIRQMTGFRLDPKKWVPR